MSRTAVYCPECEVKVLLSKGFKGLLGACVGLW